MKSTGEVMGTDSTLEKALYKAFEESYFHLPAIGNVIMIFQPLFAKARFRQLSIRSEQSERQMNMARLFVILPLNMVYHFLLRLIQPMPCFKF